VIGFTVRMWVRGRVVVFAGEGTEDMSWSLNFEVWHYMACCVLMCYGHSISSPSLTLTTNTTLIRGKVNCR